MEVFQGQHTVSRLFFLYDMRVRLRLPGFCRSGDESCAGADVHVSTLRFLADTRGA